jgi:hypothetical protein
MHWQEFGMVMMVQLAVLEAYVSEVLHPHLRLHPHGETMPRLHHQQLPEDNIILFIKIMKMIQSMTNNYMLNLLKYNEE